jgi:UDP-2,4-diacetamido-2,4,6-trideoxy-beta-L-altropyranose hydrolase
MRGNILIRTDGSAEIGLGHVVRCVSLAHMLKASFDICFFLLAPSEKVISILKDNSFKIVSLSSENDFFELIRYGHTVVLDGYQFDIDYQQKVKRKGAKLVYIDDLHDKEYVADIILNHVPGVDKEMYRIQSPAIFLLGPDHAMIRPLFLQQARENRKIAAIHTVFICFGGSDYKNLTCSVLRLVLKEHRFERVIVVTGAEYQYLKELDAICLSEKRVSRCHAVDERGMISLMLQSQLTIVPASGILYEAIALRCFIITGKYTDNQTIFLQEFSKFDNVFSVGDFNDFFLNQALKKVFESTYNPSIIIDGRSGERIEAALLSIQ